MARALWMLAAACALAHIGVWHLAANHAAADDAEKPSPATALAAALGRLKTLAEGETIDSKTAAKALAVARESLQRHAASQQITLSAAPKVPEATRMVLLEDVKASNPESVKRLWERQARMNVDTAVKHYEAAVKKGGLAKAIPLIAGCLDEAAKCCALLQRAPAAVTVSKTDLLFSDDFSKGTDNWVWFGRGEWTVTDTGLRQRNLKSRNPWGDTHTWCKKPVSGNFLVEFTLVANNEGTNRQAGLLFSICGMLKEKDAGLSASVGRDMGNYINSMYAYHFSIHRGQSGFSNARKVVAGAMRLICQEPDPATEEGKPYRVGVGKYGNTIFLAVDGTLIQHYVDIGVYGPPLDGGHFGPRHWFMQDATYGDYRVYRLAEKAPAGRREG